MSGGKSKEEAVTIMDQTSKILAKGNFKLKKCYLSLVMGIVWIGEKWKAAPSKLYVLQRNS